MTGDGQSPPSDDEERASTKEIHRVGIGGGSPEGENSTYVLPERRTVVDPGPPGDAAWATLQEGIFGAGIRPRNVEHVVVTHWHADHAGLAPRLRECADATLWMGEADAPLLREYAAARERRIERDAGRLHEWGVPQETIETLQSGDAPSPFPDEVPVQSLQDGDAVGDTDLTAIHLPGHTAGHVGLRVPAEMSGEAPGDRGEGTHLESLLVGDLILPTYTPNVGGGDTRMKRPLATYLKSLDRVEHLVTKGVCRPDGYPGHGTQLDLIERIDEIREHHEQRADRVVDAVERLERQGSRDLPTAWDVARDLFGEMAGIHAKMGAGEAASHLDELVADGVLVRADSPKSRTGPIRYTTVRGD